MANGNTSSITPLGDYLYREVCRDVPATPYDMCRLAARGILHIESGPWTPANILAAAGAAVEGLFPDVVAAGDYGEISGLVDLQERALIDEIAARDARGG